MFLCLSVFFIFTVFLPVFMGHMLPEINLIWFLSWNSFMFVKQTSFNITQISHNVVESRYTDNGNTSRRQRSTLRSFRRDTRSSVSNSNVSGTESIDRDHAINWEMLSRAWNEHDRAAEWYVISCFEDRDPLTRIDATIAGLFLSPSYPSLTRCQSHSDGLTDDIRKMDCHHLTPKTFISWKSCLDTQLNFS